MVVRPAHLPVITGAGPHVTLEAQLAEIPALEVMTRRESSAASTNAPGIGASDVTERDGSVVQADPATGSPSVAPEG
jgi:hypothetical protein